MGLTKKFQQASEQVKQKIAEKRHEVAEKVNPYSDTHKKERAEHKAEKIELQKTEKEAYKKELITQAETRGQNKAKQKFGTYKPAQRQQRTAPRRSSGGGGRSHRSNGGAGFYSASNVPEYHEAYSFAPPQASFAAPDAWGNYNNKPKMRTTQGPTETTTVKQNGQTITIKKKLDQNSQQQNQQTNRAPTYDFPDILAIGPPPQTKSPKNNFGKKKEQKWKDPFDEWISG